MKHLTHYNRLIKGETIKTIDIVCHDGETRACRIEQYIEGYIAFVACFDGDYSNRHCYASAANALRAAQTWRDLPATPAPEAAAPTSAELISIYTDVFNACAALPELHDVAMSIDYAPLDGDTVAAITNAYEAAALKLSRAAAPASPDGLYWLKCKRCGHTHHTRVLVDALICCRAGVMIEVADVTPILRRAQYYINRVVRGATETLYVCEAHKNGHRLAGSTVWQYDGDRRCDMCAGNEPTPAPQAIIEAPADVLTMQVYGTPAHGKTTYTNATPDVIAPATTPQIPEIDQQRALIVDRAIETGKTYTDQHLIDFPMLRTVALDYVSEYTGANTFVRDLAQRLDESGTLSHRQLRGALNVLVAEAKIARYENSDRLSKADAIEFDRRHNDGGGSAVEEYYIDLRTKEGKEVDSAGDAAVDADSANEIVPQIPNGIYTVLLTADQAGQSIDRWQTIRIKNAPAHFTNVKAGTQIAMYLFGSDNENDYKSFAFVQGRKGIVWRAFRGSPDLVAALGILTADPMGAAAAYVKRSGKCFVCNRTLTVPESIAGGIGPVCRAKVEAMGFTFKVEASPAVKARATMSQAQAQREIDELF